DCLAARAHGVVLACVARDGSDVGARQHPRQRPRRRDHEAGGLHCRRRRVPSQQRSRGHGGHGRDELPATGARRRHREDVVPGQLGGALVDGDRRARGDATLGQRLRRAGARRERLLRLRGHRRGRRAAARARPDHRDADGGTPPARGRDPSRSPARPQARDRPGPRVV
ncbi:MAG: Putative acyl-coA hydrolase, partial [uncultured Nocardioides sp.]